MPCCGSKNVNDVSDDLSNMKLRNMDGMKTVFEDVDVKDVVDKVDHENMNDGAMYTG